MGKMMTYFSITSQVIIDQAKKMWLQTEILQANKNFYVVRWYWKEVYFKSNDFWWNTALWYKIADDKELTNIILEEKWFNVPKSIYINKKDLKYFDIEKTKLRFPLVTKPIDEWHWNWVTVWIDSKEYLNYWIKEALKYWENVIIQDYIEWDEQRIVVIWWKVSHWYKRIPAFVIWDWIHTIKELIKKENNNPLRWNWYENILTYIEVDERLIKYIEKNWFSLISIPKIGQFVQLRWVSNTWAGGTFEDITNLIWEELKQECIEIANITWLKVVWIDIITKDISVSLKKSKWAIIEINATPWFWWINEITWINVWKELLEYVFSIND